MNSLSLSRRRTVAARAGWGMADQGLSSLTNVALGIVIARSVSASDFGAFSLAFATYLLVMGVTRAVASQPLVIRYATTGEDEWRDATRRSTGAALAVGLVASLGCLVAAVFSSGALAAAWIGLAVTMPGLMVQDCWRFALFAKGDARAAFFNDLVWALALIPLMAAAALAPGGMSVLTAILAWGVSAAAAGLYGIRQVRAVPSLRGAPQWWREHRDVIPAYAGEFGSGAGASQVSVFAIGGVASVTAVGALRAADILMGPLRSFFQAVRQVAQPEAVRIRARGGRLLRSCVAVSLGLALCAVVAGAALIVASRYWGPELLGDTWREAHPVLLPLAVSIVAAGLLAGAQLGLHALVAVKRTLSSRIVLSVMLVAFKVGGAAFGGAVGAAVGGAIAMWIGAAMWWWQLLAAAREDRGAAPSPPEEPVPPGALDQVDIAPSTP